MRHAAAGIGIDITDGSIEAALVRVVRTQSVPSLRLAGCTRRELSDTALLHGVIREPGEIATALRGALSELGMGDERCAASFALPDTQVVVSRVAFHSSQEPTYDAMEHVVEEFVSREYERINDRLVRWAFVPGPDEQDIMVYLTRTKYIHEWKRVLRGAKVGIASCEMQSHALMRALLRTMSHHEVIGMLDIGLRYSSLSFFSSRGLIYSHAIDHGAYHVGRHGRMERILDELKLDAGVRAYAPTRLLFVGALANDPAAARAVQERVSESSASIPVVLAPLPWLVKDSVPPPARPAEMSGGYESFSAAIGLALRSCGMHAPGEINFAS